MNLLQHFFLLTTVISIPCFTTAVKATEPNETLPFTQSSAVCIKLSVVSNTETGYSTPVQFVVTDPDENVTFANGRWNGDTCFVYFPDNFVHGDWQQGVYTWAGQVEGKRMTIGEFVYTNQGAITVHLGPDMPLTGSMLLQCIASSSALGSQLVIAHECMNIITMAQYMVRRPQIIGGPPIQNDFSNLDFLMLGKPVARGFLVWTDAIGDRFIISGRGVNNFTLTAIGRNGASLIYRGITATTIPTASNSMTIPIPYRPEIIPRIKY